MALLVRTPDGTLDQFDTWRECCSGHDASGLQADSDGEIQCPACPHRYCKPRNWDQTAEETSNGTLKVMARGAVVGMYPRGTWISWRINSD